MSVPLGLPTTLAVLAAYMVCAPLLGGLLAGLDRRVSARMQGRWGPPVLQPFFDVAKLLQKENMVVRRSQSFYVSFFFVFTIFTGGLFFSGRRPAAHALRPHTRGHLPRAGSLQGQLARTASSAPSAS